VQDTLSLTRTSGVSLFDTCYDLSDRTSVEVPTVSLRFEGGGSPRLPARNYLILTGIHGAGGDWDRGREEQYRSKGAGCPLH
jgi:aspartyl protease family protein